MGWYTYFDGHLEANKNFSEKSKIWLQKYHDGPNFHQTLGPNPWTVSNENNSHLKAEEAAFKASEEEYIGWFECIIIKLEKKGYVLNGAEKKILRNSILTIKLMVN